MTGRRETRATVVRRRLRTIPPYFAGLVVVTAGFPLLVLAAGLVDLVRWLTGRRRWMSVRLLGFLWVYLAAEAAGVTAGFVQWLVSGAWAGRGAQRLERWTWSLQSWWASTLLRTVTAVFGLRLEVEGEEVLAEGPMVVFFRHASIVDNLLPAVLITARRGIRLRWVIKQELLSDPALDVAGNRLPNYFVNRSSSDSAGEIERVRALADGLGPRDGVLIYPEGTRFTTAKQERALERLASGDPDLYRRAAQLRNLLPPRLGGPLALLDAGTDAVFCVHKGLGGFAHIADIWDGGLVGRRIRVRFWRVPASSVPTGRKDRIDWFYDQWMEADRWIDRQDVAG